MSRHYVELTRTSMHYTVVGTGRPLLLLHHSPRWSDYWEPLVSGLAAGRQLAMPDNPGFGNSTALAGVPLTIPALAEAMIEFADHLGWEQFDVCGTNTGSAIGVELASAHPDRVRRLAIMGVPWITDPDEQQRCLDRLDAGSHGPPASDGAELAAYWNQVMANWRYEETKRPGGATEAEARALAAAWLAGILRSGDTYPAVMRAVFSYDMRSRVRQISAPTLVVGFDLESDPDAPFSVYLKRSREAASQIAGARYVAIAGTPVTVTLTGKDQLLAELNGFFH